MDRGKFGQFGGSFVPETLVPALKELEQEYLSNKENPNFQNELNEYLETYAGRKTPLYFAKRLSEKIEGAKIYLKREDLLHTGAHKINNAIGQVLLAKKMRLQISQMMKPVIYKIFWLILPTLHKSVLNLIQIQN